MDAQVQIKFRTSINSAITSTFKALITEITLEETKALATALLKIKDAATVESYSLYKGETVQYVA